MRRRQCSNWRKNSANIDWFYRRKWLKVSHLCLGVNRIMKKIVALILVVQTVITFSFACCEASAQSAFDIEKQREVYLKKLESEIPDPKKLRRIARKTFLIPISKQDEVILQALAKQANIYANMVGFIVDEYDKFIQKNETKRSANQKIASVRNAYVRNRNEFLEIRNLAYFNLGLKARLAGENVRALLYFRDAYRLSPFDCGKEIPRERCIRWKAEMKIQELLGLSFILTYPTWTESWLE